MFRRVLSLSAVLSWAEAITSACSAPLKDEGVAKPGVSGRTGFAGSEAETENNNRVRIAYMFK